jgi:hypothetical protein
MPCIMSETFHSCKREEQAQITLDAYPSFHVFSCFPNLIIKSIIIQLITFERFYLSLLLLLTLI